MHLGGGAANLIPFEWGSEQRGSYWNL